MHIIIETLYCTVLLAWQINFIILVACSQSVGVQAVIHPAVGCHYFPPGLWLPSQPQSITAAWPIPSYTVW